MCIRDSQRRVRGTQVFEMSNFQLCEYADQGKSDKVSDMIRAGADVNVRDFLGMTPLMHAANMGQTDIAELLMDANAKCDAVDNAGRTPLMLAAAGGMIGVVELLLDRAATREVAVNARDKIDGYTALMLAALHDSAEVVQLLLVNGAKHDIKNDHGQTALEIARQNAKNRVLHEPGLKNPEEFKRSVFALSLIHI
eukprot:TRINITY_DN2200_c0_g2_i3.p1 TRINITY_DN2200_c0_g2~~TRINITY_DN2200_c0_g2_i3.p1  ORF type:complete len:210 (+),score=50.36 TRINITY_DN2200_c0_g2_i3:43-630(+)